MDFHCNFHGVPTQQCAKTISFSVRVPVLSEKTKLTYKASDPGIHLIRSMQKPFSLWPDLPHLLYQVSSPCHGAQFCPEKFRFQIDMRRNPMAQNTGGFGCPFILHLRIPVDLESQNKLYLDPKAKFGWMIWECGRCKTSPIINHHQAIIKHHQPTSTHVDIDVVLTTEHVRQVGELVPLAISKKT